MTGNIKDAIHRVSEDEAHAILAWLLQDQGKPESLITVPLTYAVLQCTDTFVWGILPVDSVTSAPVPSAPVPWHWGIEDGLRMPQAETLLEARIFSATSEILLWRTGNFQEQTFCGRKIVETGASVPPMPTPLMRQSLFEGTPRLHHGTSFVRRVMGGGQVTITPPGTGILLQEYLSACPETGVLRIAMTRFLNVF